MTEPQEQFHCDRCGQQVSASRDKYGITPGRNTQQMITSMPPPAGAEGIEAWERLLCNRCAAQRASWPWWEEIGLATAARGDFSLLIAYDENFPPCRYTTGLGLHRFGRDRSSRECQHQECALPPTSRHWS